MSTSALLQPTFSSTPLTSAYSSLVNDLLDSNLRENALAELSKQREQLPDLAIVLWSRFGNFVFIYQLFYLFRHSHNFDS